MESKSTASVFPTRESGLLDAAGMLLSRKYNNGYNYEPWLKPSIKPTY